MQLVLVQGHLVEYTIANADVHHRRRQTAPLLEEFFALMDSRRWVLALPPGADAHHEHLCDAVPGQGVPGHGQGMRKRRAESGDEAERDAPKEGGPAKRVKKDTEPTKEKTGIVAQLVDALARKVGRVIKGKKY